VHVWVLKGGGGGDEWHILLQMRQAHDPR
jgi:hypothetical protein